MIRIVGEPNTEIGYQLASSSLYVGYRLIFTINRLLRFLRFCPRKPDVGSYCNNRFVSAYYMYDLSILYRKPKISILLCGKSFCRGIRRETDRFAKICPAAIIFPGRDILRLLFFVYLCSLFPARMKKIRIGYGYDVHRLADGLPLWLGGVRIPYGKGEVAHSDGDVLIHAVCDALLGALALGDIGVHFPDTSAEFKDIDSKLLLRRTVALIKEKGYCVGNVDAMLCLEKPKINPFVEAMRKTLAVILETGEEDVSVKATTREKLGFVGREEGVEAFVSVLLFHRDMLSSVL